jgi:D-alanyl-lipoteichoic acid acyltransferase DltB (MBOAT superfamily)
MVFNSYTFIVFFVILLGLHNLNLPWKLKKINLLWASYLFYALWNPPFILLLWLSTVVDFYAAKLMAKEERPLQRKLLLTVSLILNLGMLSYFKYGGFLLENFNILMSSIGIAYQAAKPDIILPIGISFYTFVTLSYTIDIYRKKFAPEKSFLDFALFVTYFPHLVAGPIVRPENLLPQFKSPVKATRDQFMWGLFLITLGLFLKVGIADGMVSETADFIFGLPCPVNPIDAWSAVLAFSAQIFCDFAGYSTCAIGVSLCLGFTLPDNFRYPYAAIGFSDFWQRWHITLSSWLRDYLYIPLGGNRKGSGILFMNLMITMLLGGLWHGASWTFVVWGGLHGIYLCVERLIRNVRKKSDTVIQSANTFSNFMLALLTFILINITWVFFRAQDFGKAMLMILSMFGVIPNAPKFVSTLDVYKIAIVTVGLLATHWFMRNSSLSELGKKMKWWQIGFAWAAMLIIVILTQKSSGSFIYFQF